MSTFAVDLEKFSQRTSRTLEASVREIVMELGRRIVEKSPVGDGNLWKNPPPAGYVGGRFRANWQYSFGAVTNGDLPDIDPSGAVSVARLTAGVNTSPAAGMHYIHNNLPYAKRLEDGWSTQAPSGMVGLTAIEFQQIVQRVTG
jgi:hypothetical protein